MEICAPHSRRSCTSSLRLQAYYASLDLLSSCPAELKWMTCQEEATNHYCIITTREKTLCSNNWSSMIHYVQTLPRKLYSRIHAKTPRARVVNVMHASKGYHQHQQAQSRTTSSAHYSHTQTCSRLLSLNPNAPCRPSWPPPRPRPPKTPGAPLHPQPRAHARRSRSAPPAPCPRGP